MNCSELNNSYPGQTGKAPILGRLRLEEVSSLVAFIGQSLPVSRKDQIQCYLRTSLAPVLVMFTFLFTVHTHMLVCLLQASWLDLCCAALQSCLCLHPSPFQSLAKRAISLIPTADATLITTGAPTLGQCLKAGYSITKKQILFSIQ